MKACKSCGDKIADEEGKINTEGEFVCFPCAEEARGLEDKSICPECGDSSEEFEEEGVCPSCGEEAKTKDGEAKDGDDEDAA